MNKWQSLFLLLGVACAMSSSAEVICGSSQYLPNPNDCGSYYECSNGIANLIKCPTGLEFSVTSNSCNYPQLAQCGSSNTVVTVPSISDNFPKYYCPEVDGTTAYIYPNPSSCSSYYMCSGGSLHLYQCQTGLEYSVEERGCDYPYRAKCDLNNLPNFPSGPTSPESVGPTTLTSVGPTPGYYCPEVDGPTAYIYPNPLSCSSYYMCAGGSLHFYQCQTGLEYSVEERGCDYPYRAKCDLNNLPNFPSGPTTLASVGPTPGYYCPEVDGPTAYIYPNPLSCSSYYMCAVGSLHFYQCQTGLEYSVEERGCDYPYRAKCDLNNLPNFPSGPTTLASVGPTPGYYCPEVDGPTAYIYPNPSSCSSYYMCAGGSLHLYQCQTGLEYSVEERGCDYPYRAKCDLNNLPNFPSGPTSPESVGPTTLTSVGPTPGYYCPEVDGPTAYIYPNPLSCSSYYMCSGGYLHFYQCQTGLEYSVEERGCDYPDRAKCDLNNLPTFPTGPTTSSPIASSTNLPVNVLCPANVETLVRDPTDCGKFYECNYGIPTRESCYPGLYFSEKNQACDYPQNVPECTST